MADLTVDQSFQKFLSNLNPTDRQRQRIQKTRESIDAALINDPRIFLNTQKQISFLTGSYSRRTIIRPLDDIDLYVRIHYGEHAKGQSPLSIMRLMASAIRKRYPNNTSVKVDSPCIVVSFFDYKFEIVPAYGHDYDLDLYSVPAPGSGEWMQCYPNVPYEWLAACNHTNNNYFTPLIKMLKLWNRHNSVKLKSFHLELLTEKVFSSVTGIYSYPQAIYDWMLCVKELIWSNDYPFIIEPGKSYTYVDEYMYEKRLKLHMIRRKLDVGLKKAERAWNFYRKGRFAASKRIWNNMFGPKFPVPQPTQQLVAPAQPLTPAATLGDLLANQQPTELLGGMHQNALLDRLSDPFSFSKPAPPKNNALLNLLAQYNDPFKK